MTTIDIENAKQIRQPMDVIIQIAAAETATLTYSGYSAAKVADGELDEPDWPMRKLADLQGDGFLLDGSAVLYDSAVTASAANGKIGVRGNIGQPVTVSVTASASVDRLTVSATGCRAVEYNGITYSMRNGYSIIPIGGTSAVFVFQPETDTKRVEVSDIRPGVQMRITNENLISAVVSLRSDLSILEPTLPESEINVEAYMDEDYSELLASIPDETPITYQAGYDGDMSPVRKFYLAEQITWADNVMSIHAVDAVYLLDCDLWPGTVGYEDEDGTPTYLYLSLLYSLDVAGIVPSRPDGYISDDNIATDDFTGAISIIPHTTPREWMAKVCWLFHVDMPAGSTEDDYGFWPTYVDAGIPTIKWKKPVSKWGIEESDCGDVSRGVGRTISSLTIKHAVLKIPSNEYIYSSNFPDVGSCTLINNVGASISFDDYVYGGYSFDFRDKNNTRQFPVTVIKGRTSQYIDYLPVRWTNLNGGIRDSYGRALMIPGIPQSVFDAYPTVSRCYTQFVPWDSRMSSMWSSLKTGGANEISADNVPGKKISYDEVYETYTGQSSGESVNIDDTIWYGGIASKGTDAIMTQFEVFPALSMQSIINRSPITGSFTWKGDPRMQPRDVFTFHRLDGTDEVCTLENITLTHSQGGTTAEVTYRKGVC